MKWSRPDPYQIYPTQDDHRRSWPGLIILLALIVAGLVLLICSLGWLWG